MSPWLELFLVAAGGAAGSAARWGVSQVLTTAPRGAATFVVNTLGCALMGVLAARFAQGHPARALLGVGLLGGFTTWSTFALDVVHMGVEGRSALAFGFAAATVLSCFGGCWIGLRLAS